MTLMAPPREWHADSTFVPFADRLYDAHLEELRKEGLIK